MKRTALAATATFVFATTIFAQSGNPPAPAKDEAAAKPAPTEQGVRKLTRRQRKEKTSKLDHHFQEFLSDVEPILMPTEVDTLSAEIRMP